MLTHTLAVASETSLIICSNLAVSSACRWLWSAIFSLNFRGLFAMIAIHWRLTALRDTRGKTRSLFQGRVRCSVDIVHCVRWAQHLLEKRVVYWFSLNIFNRCLLSVDEIMNTDSYTKLLEITPAIFQQLADTLEQNESWKKVAEFSKQFEYVFMAISIINDKLIQLR